MIKRLNVLIVLAAAAGVAGLVVVMSRAERTEGLRVHGKAIEIFGQGYTLARLADEVGDPAVLAYDAARREAEAKASLVVRGGLRIGDPDDRRRGETLVLDTVVCGDLRLEVARGGRLEVYHSEVTTKSRMLTADQCSRGYALVVDGTLAVADSRFLYMSGSRSETARERARVDLDRAVFSLSDGCSFHTVRLDGRRADIRDSRFRCEGRFGFIVEGLGDAPVVLRRCLLSGRMADLALTGRRAAAELVDCQFSKAKIKFFHRRGRVVVRWTVKATVVERGSGRPLPGIAVTATSSGKVARETVESRTAADGTCQLVLGEYVATPEAPLPQEGLNLVTPHRIAARSAAGKVLAEVAAYRAEGPRGEVTLEVPPQPLAASR